MFADPRFPYELSQLKYTVPLSYTAKYFYKTLLRMSADLLNLCGRIIFLHNIFTECKRKELEVRRFTTALYYY